MSTPVIFTITPEGLDAAVTQDSIGLSVELVSISAHLVDGTEWGRFDLSGGLVEPTTHTARFSAILKSTTAHSAYQLKIWTSDDIVFAQAVSASPLAVVAANIDFAASFGLALTGTPAGSVTISINPDDSVAQALMIQHVGAEDPHPQYKAYALGLVNAEAETRQAQVDNLQEQLNAFLGGLGNGSYTVGTYTINIYPSMSKTFKLWGSGAGGGGTRNDGNYYGTTNGANGADTFLSGYGVIAGGGLAGIGGSWANGSAYHDGTGGAGGTASGASTTNTNGNAGVALTANQSGGAAVSFGHGAGGAGATTNSSGYSQGGGGGSGAYCLHTITNSGSSVITVTLVVGAGGIGGAGLGLGGDGANGTAGVDGYAIVES